MPHAIAKKNNPAKKRPLGIPATEDRLVQEVIRMILESIYEPTFSHTSHGFRPNRSCHTALLDIQKRFYSVKWIVEGDIKACFDSFDHHVLINILRKRIQDERFISLMWKFLKSGYMEQWEYHSTYSGTPQGSGMSPLLANIYLSELDDFVEKYRTGFEKIPEHGRKACKAYHKARRECDKAKKRLAQADVVEYKEARANFKQCQRQMHSILYSDPIDPDYKRLQYNRYADDFIIGIIGSREDAERVKQAIRTFLQDTLHLTLSDEKTKISHSSELIRYLGYDITICRSRDATRNCRGTLMRQWYGAVQLYVPREKWESKLTAYGAMRIKKERGTGREIWKPIHRGVLQNMSDVAIVSRYNAEIRGIYNYYRLAKNASVIGKFAYIMRRSMQKTLAAKYRTSCRVIRKKFERNGVFSVPYTTKAGPKQCEFIHDGYKKQSKAYPINVDVLPQYRRYDRPNSLVSRLRAKICELCNEEDVQIHMYHVRALKDLDGHLKSGSRMLQKRRKSLALCPHCFDLVNKGLL